MRTIKFRAWDKEHKNFNETVAANLLLQIHEPSEDIDEEYGKRFFLEQFTGLKDKNRNEIYEGDILKIETDKPMVVGWSKRFASFILNREGWAFSHWFGESCNPENCEIIGNIHENPELWIP